MKRCCIGWLAVVGLLGFLVPYSASAADGAALYKKHCKRCHGDDGKGVEKMLKPMKLQDKGPDALSVVKQSAKDMSDEDMMKLIREGKGKMKPYKAEKLGDDDAKAVIAHVRSMQK